MAIRYRKGRASPWQCYWNNPLTGKRECANFATRHEAEKHDSLIKHRLKFDRESFQGEEKEEKESTELTLEACYVQYLKEKQFSKKGLSWQMDAMRYPLQKLGGIPIINITRKHLEEIRGHFVAQPVTSATARGRLSVLRTVLRWCVAQGYREQIDFPTLPPAHYKRFIPPSPEELGAIMACAAPHIVRVIILGAQCGVRVGPSELFRLTWHDVDLIRGILRVHGAKKNLNAAWREVPIRESLLPIFMTWKREDEVEGMEYLIHHNGKPVKSIKNAWNSTLKRTGITRHIRPYDLRHEFATELIAQGIDIGTVAKLMGHSSPAMLLNHYQFVMDSQKRAAVESLPDLGACAHVHVPKRKAPAGVSARA
ncbi:MAG: tyrosine-type recombinase/integrase [Desulfovibrionaceae bacterium]|nr:tyrosine-type recombinase/integrase [Desulfovibrionaceae bacterium]